MTPPPLFTRVQVGVLRRVAPPIPVPLKTVYDGKSKLAATFGEDFLKGVEGLTVVDFGCGAGLEAIEMAKAGARSVLGIEISEDLLAAARHNAERAGVADRCRFASQPEGNADLVVSLDCFEHYADPQMVLQTVRSMLRPEGTFHISFGPPWFHPFGSHLVELPPWTHVFFSEEAVVRWRQLMRGGNAVTYSEIGLNRMTISRFRRTVRESGFRIDSLRIVPIRSLRWLHNRLTREFTTSVVQCLLRKYVQ